MLYQQRILGFNNQNLPNPTNICYNDPMQERYLQFSIFGEFDNITLNDILKLTMFKKTLPNLEVSPDINPRSPQHPTLLSEDRNECIIFETGRIVYQKNNSGIKDFASSMKFAKSSFSDIVKTLELSINRLGCGGTFTGMDQAGQDKIYSKVFKPDKKLIGKNSSEWKFRINNPGESKKLGCTVNRLITCMRSEHITSPIGEDVGQFILEYDYNTVIDAGKNFSSQDMDQFISECTKFRNEVLAL